MTKKLKYLSYGLVLLVIMAVWVGYKADVPKEVLQQKYELPSSNYITVEGMQVHYTKEETDNNTPLLVLLHGTSASLHTWEGWVQALQNDFSIVRLDLPAFGLTGPHPQHDYSIASYVDFLHHFLDAIQLDTCYLAGNSLGGYIAWSYALQYPQQVKKLILIDATGFPFEGNRPFAFRLAQNKLSSPLVRYFTPKSLVSKSLADVYFDDNKVTPALIDRYYDFAVMEGNREAFVARVKTPYVNKTQQLNKLEMPTLIQWGQHDEWVPLDWAYLFAKQIPNTTLRVYDNAGHVPMEEIPTITAADAMLFLQNN